MLTLPPVISHRGASAYAPENTLAALSAAKDKGATWVECDIQLSRDGTLFVFHDLYLKRMTRTSGRLDQYNSDFLQQCKVNDSGNMLMERQYIPTLKSWLQQAANLGLSVNIELKSTPSQAQQVAKELIKLITQQNSKKPLNNLLFSSKSNKNLKCLLRYIPSIPRALVVTYWHGKRIAQALEANCAAMHLNYNLITKKRVAEIQQNSMQVAAFTVNSSKKAKLLLKQGVGTVFSDYPDLLTSRIEHK